MHESPEALAPNHRNVLLSSVNKMDYTPMNVQIDPHLNVDIDNKADFKSSVQTSQVSDDNQNPVVAGTF